MEQDFKFAGSVIKRKTVAVFFLGIPALAPLFFMSRAVVELNSNYYAGADRRPSAGSTSMDLPHMPRTGVCHWFLVLCF